MSSFFVAFALGQLVAGPLSDRFGRKPLVLGGLAVFAAGSVLCALADTLPLLVLGRVIQALGACAASVLSRAIARDLFDGEALGRALALTMIAGAAAPGFSPLLGSVLAGLFGWRVTFLVVAAFGVVLALHYSSRVGETHPVDRRTPLALSAVASSLWPPGRRSSLSTSRAFGEPRHRRALQFLRGRARRPDERTGPDRLSARIVFRNDGSDRLRWRGFSRRAWLIAGASAPSA